MTIKEFARLCDCNPQTLRYYDQVQLLKPEQVDPHSGYRHYSKEQAVTFVHIKNLQKAGFSIEEIKTLLPQGQQAIRKAFDAKIAQAEEKLREIKEIQRSYQTEMHQIQEAIKEITENILQKSLQYDPAQEFGITEKQYAPIVNQIQQYMQAANEQVSEFQSLPWISPEYSIEIPEKEDPDIHQYLIDPTYTLMYENHGWANAKDFLPECIQLEQPGTYLLCLQLTEEKKANGIPFMNTLLSMMLAANENMQKTLTCEAASSPDGQNHFWLLKCK